MLNAALTLAFIEEHGAVLVAAKGAAPRLVEVILGEPIRGSWWAHPASHGIFAVLTRVGACADPSGAHGIGQARQSALAFPHWVPVSVRKEAAQMSERAAAQALAGVLGCDPARSTEAVRRRRVPSRRSRREPRARDPG